MTGLLVFRFAVLIAVEFLCSECIVFKQKMITSRRNKEKPSGGGGSTTSTPTTTQPSAKEDDNRYLDEECEEDDQCTYYAKHAHCMAKESVSVCSCMEGFAREIEDNYKCVLESIEVAGNMELVEIPWDDDMLVPGSEIFNSTTTMVVSLLLELEEVIRIEDIYIVNHNGIPDVYYTVMVYNPDAETPSVKRRWTIDRRRRKNANERRRIQEVREELFIYKIKEIAYLHGININNVSCQTIVGRLNSLCFDHSDCIMSRSSCFDSVCSCINGVAKMQGAEDRCI